MAIPAPAVVGVSAETALAERYAPVLQLVEQQGECGYGEPYRPRTWTLCSVSFRVRSPDTPE